MLLVIVKCELLLSIMFCYLVGKSKGYGFVEWQHNKEKSSQAREMLDNKKLGSCTLHCEFLESSVLSFDDLHSKCIRVDHLPSNYSNASELLNILSRIQSPRFFRVSELLTNSKNALKCFQNFTCMSLKT